MDPLKTMVDPPAVVVAMDFPALKPAAALAERLDPSLCRLKVGKELFTREGPAVVERLMALGFEVFLDLKFHDIPHTVRRACAAAAELGVWMLNVHALGGRRMLEAAREGIARSPGSPYLIAVTVLTSLSEDELREVGLGGSPLDNVTRLARLAQGCELDGVVCSPREAGMLRREHGPDFRLVTPGIRPAAADQDDQTRQATATSATQAGADYLVVGRPVTQAADPVAALQGLHDEITRAGPPEATY